MISHRGTVEDSIEDGGRGGINGGRIGGTKKNMRGHDR